MRDIIKKTLIEEMIDEGHISKTPENDFTNRIIDMLDHPPYLYTLESMGLTEEDIVKVFKKMYGGIVGVRYKKGSVRVKDELRNTLYMETLDNDRTLWSKWEWYPRSDDWRRFVDERGDRRYRTRSGVVVYDEHIEGCCSEELEDGFYPPLPTGINEGIGNSQIKKRMDISFLDKVLKDVVRDTELDNLGLHLPFHYGSLYISSKKEISKLLTHKEYDYRESFYGYVMDLYSLTMEESVYCYPKYVELLVDKFNKTGNLTEETTQSNSNGGGWYYQYVFDSKYLSRVLEQLLTETKMEWDTDTGNVIVKVDWNPSNPNILYQSSYGTFKKHCQEVYSLKNGEIADMYTLYIMEIKKILREKEGGGSRLTLESVSPQVSKVVTHKGKLNFIDRITDLMMDETYVVDMEPPKGSNSDWYVEGMRKIYFYKGDNSLGRDDVEGIITPGQSFNEFGNKYTNETFSAIFSHLRRFSSDNIGTEMEIYIWVEYLYRLREKYFGGGEGPPLAKMKQM
jgi:hypothetical protein